MEIDLIVKHEITPKNLAKALSEAEPSEFAAVWFAFAERCHGPRLDEFAKAMAEPLGSARKRPLRELCKLMDYHEMRNNRMEDVKIVGTET